VIAIGAIMIPALIRHGYDERFSIGLMTSTGSLGILIPPSIPMVLYALVMNVSVGKLFIAGILPGLLIALLLIAYSFMLATRHNWKTPVTYAKGERWRLIRSASWGIAMPVIILGGIYTGIFTPTEASAVAVVYALFVEFFIYKDMDLKKLNEVLKESVILSSVLLFIIACAMAFIWLLTREKLPVLAAEFIVTHIQNKYLFLFVINIFFIFVGCFMDIVSAVVVISPILLIALQQYDIDLVHFGIIMIVNIELGFLTFPFGLNLFVAMGITGKPLTEIGRAVLPFMALIFFGLMLITYVPSISLWLTRVL
jgi:C4-dicarboxylate transporter DctM subunit